MVRHIFIDPLLDHPENVRSYENIQGAYTYIMRNWNCKRHRAKMIYKAVNDGNDISNWPETIWALDNISKYKNSNNVTRKTEDNIYIDHINIDSPTLDNNITLNNDKDNNNGNDKDKDKLIAEISYLRLQVEKLTNIVENRDSNQYIIKSITDGFTDALIKMSHTR